MERCLSYSSLRPHTLYISLCTFSNFYTQSDEHSISAEFFNESKSVHVELMFRRGMVVDVPSGWISVIRGPHPDSVVWPKGHPQGVRIRHNGQRNRSSFVSLRRSLFRRRRLEEFLQCENERLLTPSEQRRQRESAGCKRPSSVWETEMPKPRRHWSHLLPKAQKQAEVPHTRQIEETREFIARARKRILHADEKIRLAEQAVAEAKKEKYDLRELPLAESRLERLQAEERVFASCPASPPPSDLGSSDLISDATGTSFNQKEISRRC